MAFVPYTALQQRASASSTCTASPSRPAQAGDATAICRRRSRRCCASATSLDGRRTLATLRQGGAARQPGAGRPAPDRARRLHREDAGGRARSPRGSTPSVAAFVLANMPKVDQVEPGRDGGHAEPRRHDDDGAAGGDRRDLARRRRHRHHEHHAGVGDRADARDRAAPGGRGAAGATCCCSSSSRRSRSACWAAWSASPRLRRARRS